MHDIDNDLILLIGFMFIIKMEEINYENHTKSVRHISKQLPLFESSNKITTHNKRSMAENSFETFWKRIPEKAGKTNARKLWGKLKNDREQIIRVWNSLFIYLKDIQRHRRRGFYKQFKNGDTFLRSYIDWLDYDHELIQDLNEIINKVDSVLGELKEEDKINVSVSKIKLNHKKLMEGFI